MSFNAAPTNLLGANYVADATTLTLLLADFTDVTTAEADESTGDSRKVIYGILEQINTAYAALASADKPLKMRINKTSTAPNASGVFQQTFTVTFDVEAASVDVAAES